MTETGCKLWQFGYDDYIEKTALLRGDGGNANNVSSTGKTASKSAFVETQSEPTAAQSSYQAGKEQSRNRKKIQKLEEEIERLEAEGEAIKEKMADPEIASSYMKLSEVQAELDANEERLLELMDEWEKLNEG